MTKNLSGAARATIDACRTLFVWAFSLGIGWERFHALEVSSRAGQSSFMQGKLPLNEDMVGWSVFAHVHLSSGTIGISTAGMQLLDSYTG